MPDRVQQHARYMKLTIPLFLAVLIPLASGHSQEARNLNTTELDASFSKAATAVKRAGGSVPGARRSRVGVFFTMGIILPTRFSDPE